jgi:hypothetical protein
MKKILLLIGIFITINSFAQKQMTKEEVKTVFANGMVKMVNDLKPYYNSLQTSTNFKATVNGADIPLSSGTALLDKAFLYLQNSTSDAEILNTFSGKEMADAVVSWKSILDVNSNSEGSEVFGKTTNANGGNNSASREGGCRWYQIGCMIEWLNNWVSANWSWLSQLLQMF